MSKGGELLSRSSERQVFSRKAEAEGAEEKRHLLSTSVDFTAIKPHEVSEFLGNPDQKFSVPLSDVLKDPAAAAAIWPRHAEDITLEIEQHRESAEKITRYLDNCFYGRGEASDLAADREGYYAGVSELLDNPETRRIALFLPFETFPDSDDRSAAAEQFRANFTSAWQDLLFVEDVRANFVDGDVYEVDARPEDPERVIKATHLTPWLVQKGIIDIDTVVAMAKEEPGSLLARGFIETVPLMDKMGLLSDEARKEFDEISDTLPERAEALPPRYISIARAAWLSSEHRKTPRPTEATEDLYTLGLPASSRIPSLSSEILASEKLIHRLDPSTSGVVLLGGSRLKGYGRPDSDLDLYIVTSGNAKNTPEAYVRSLEAIKADPASRAHEVFNMLEIGSPEDIKKLQEELGPLYFEESDPSIRRWTTEKLEQDLLEYRLLHKGYPRLCPDTNPELKSFVEMDGESAFYETGYRVIATKLYASSVFVPHVHSRN